MNLSIAKRRLNEVIRTDVVASSQADFLATHVALKHIKVTDNGWNNANGNIEYLSEEEIFSKYVLNKENKHQFIIVKGQSGVGKSHLIRWFYACLERLNYDDEEVLFIRRSDNNLKKTIEQLLKIDAVASIQNKNIIERLVKASNTIDDNKFKDLVYSNFIVEIRNDEKTDKLDNHTKKNLEALLQNDMFQSKLLDIGGPIDRICSKVSNNSNVGDTEIVALFHPKDFEVDIYFCDELRRQGADRKAQKMAEKIYAKAVKTEDIANYLNQFVDSVIQICAGIEPGDFENIFNEIRKELKKNGKNLTLLIEDITAFTGVNEALLNVLTTEHTGDYEKQKMCRLSSFVGTTNQYYDSFQANLVDRVTNQILIEDNPFGQNNNELYQFVARYLNAMSLESDNLMEWMENNCRKEEYPVHNEVEGKEWEHFEIEKGINVSIYPFTFNAIKWLYEILPNKTPRYLLKNVIEIVVKDVMFNKDKFPAFTIPTLPIWNETDGIVLTTQISDTEMLERLNRFICVWGDASIIVQKIEGVKYIGGISEVMYKEFGMPIIQGRISSKTITIMKHLKTVEQNKTEPVERPIEAKKLTKDELQYQEEIRGIELWLQGKTFDQFKTVRDNMCNFLMDTIEWQIEGVSYDTIVKLKNSKRNLIEFNRQKLEGYGLIILPDDRKTAIVVQAFLAWDLLGKKKWNFSGATYMRYQVELWFNEIKDKVVNAVKKIGKEDNCFETSCIAEIYRLILFGQYKRTTLNSITPELLLESALIEIPSENEHSKDWNDLMVNIYRHENKAVKMIASHKNTIKHFFNLYQGDIGENYSSRFFIDRDSFAKRLDAIIKNQLKMDYSFLDSDDMLPSRKDLTINTKDIVNIVDNRVAVSEKTKAKELLTKVKYFFESDEVYEDDITDLCDDIREFYKKFAQQQFNIIPKNDMISAVKKESKEIINAITIVKKAVMVESQLELILAFSQDPMKKIKKLLDLLEAVENDMLRMKEEIVRRHDKLVVGSNVLRDASKQNALNETIGRYEEIIKGLEK